jgi:ferredoxin-NADP reductase
MNSTVRTWTRGFAALVEPLLTPHGTDRYLELVHPMLVRGEIRAQVLTVRHQTVDTVTLTVRPNRAWPGFIAGQYVRVSVDIDGVRNTRCYSPASSQHGRDGLLEFTIKAHDNGLVSQYLNSQITPGAVLGLAAPAGEFTLPERRPERIVLISAGSGITPVLAMYRTLVDERHTGDVVLVHYASGPDDTLYCDEFAKRHATMRTVLGYTNARHPAPLHGHFSLAHLAEVAPWYHEATTYACGPARLLSSVRAEFDSVGLGEQLHTEQFTLDDIRGAAKGGTIRFTRSDLAITNSGEPLLNQAENAGLNLAYGCRMGICHSCTKVKTIGQVRDAVSGQCSAEENEEIRLCVSLPVGDVDINA